MGRLSNKELRRRIEEARRPQYGPPVPKGLGWGGSRSGSGRKKKADSRVAMFRLDEEFAGRLAGLPQRARSEYLRQAIDLMITISPPEQFRQTEAVEPEEKPKEEGEPTEPSEPPQTV